MMGVRRSRKELQGQQELWNSLERSGEARVQETRCKISTGTKMYTIKVMMMNVAMYASKTWTLKKQDRYSLLAFENFEMKCYSRILRIRWEQKITNEEVCRRVRCRKNIVQQIMERKLNLFGHICRMKDNRLVKEVIFTTMEGEMRRGKPCIEWLDDIKE